MADNKELAAFIMDELSELGNVRNIPMMGGYVFYYNERIFGGIYESGFMVKVTKAGRKYMPDSIPEPPYDGAKEMLPVTILENRQLLCEMVREMYDELPERKPKKKAGGNKKSASVIIKAGNEKGVIRNSRSRNKSAGIFTAGPERNGTHIGRVPWKKGDIIFLSERQYAGVYEAGM